jgi:hypothetical protein
VTCSAAEKEKPENKNEMEEGEFEIHSEITTGKYKNFSRQSEKVNQTVMGFLVRTDFHPTYTESSRTVPAGLPGPSALAQRPPRPASGHFGRAA